MPANTTETVPEHSTRLQPSINLQDPVIEFVQLLWYLANVLPGRDEGSGKPCAVIEASIALTQDSNPGGDHTGSSGGYHFSYSLVF